MATFFTFPFGPGQTTDNVTGLAAGQAKVLGSVGDGTLIFDIVVSPILITTGAGAAGSIDLFLAISENGGAPPTGIWDGGIDPTLSTDQSAKLAGGEIRRVSSISVQSATGYYFPEFSCPAFLGFFAMYYCPIIYNNTGVAFSATAAQFSAHYSRQNFASPQPLIYA